MFLNKRKTIIPVIITVLTLAFASTAFAQFSDVSNKAVYYEAITNLHEMGIINGFSENEFRPLSNVTRAEFVKMMVIAMNKKGDAVSLNSGSSAFTDIKPDNWAIGYISAAVKNQIITGYADGSFKPNEKVNFAQVCTVLLRSLGYTSSEMPGVWPQNYIEKARDLKITDGINLKFSDKVSRAQLAVMLERTLNTESKNSTQTLAEKSGLGTSKTVIITDSWDLDSTLPEGMVKTDIGSFTAVSFNGIEYLGKKIDILSDDNNKILSARSVKEDSHTMLIESISGNRVTYSDKSGSGSMDIPEDLTFYYKGQKSTFNSIKQNVSIGSVISIALAKADTQSYDYGVLIDPPASNPVVVKKVVGVNDKSIGTLDISDRSKIIVIKEGEKISLGDIKPYDVAYIIRNPYSNNQNILMIYDDKKTGTYDEAIPNKSVVQKIKLLGEELTIGTADAAAKLNNSAGAFAIGDQITVLTGKGGQIVDVVTSSPSDVSNIAVVMSARSGLSTKSDEQGKTVYYVTLYKIDGTTTEYEADEDQMYHKGVLVRYDLKNDIAHITLVTGKSVSGRIDISEKKIGDLWMDNNAAILDIHTGAEGNNVQISRLNWQDMPSGDLSADEVIYAETGGAFNDIQLLVLDNLTEAGQYGILAQKSESQNSSSYTIMIAGKAVSITTEGSKFACLRGDAVYIEKDDNGSLQEMRSLSPKAASSEIQAVDSRRIKINDKIYRLSNDVAVYDITNINPVSMSISDLTTGGIKYAAVYAGVNESSQSLIKVVTFQRY